MLIMRHLLILAGILILQACGSAVPTRTAEPLVPEFTYRLDERLSASVGQPMTSSSPLMLAKVLVFKEPLKATTEHRGKVINVRAPAGTYSMTAQDSNGYFFRSNTGRLTVDGESHPGSVYLPFNSSDRGGLCWRWGRDFAGALPPEVYIAYFDANPSPASESRTPKLPPGYYDGLVATLSYVGKSDQQIRFVYREYNDGRARDAYTYSQQIEFDYEPDKSFSYKSARFTVHEADSLGISYTLHRPL